MKDTSLARAMQPPDELAATHPPVALASPRRPRRLRRALGTLLVLVSALALAAYGACAWIVSEPGHQWLARALEDGVSSQIRGRLIVGHLDEIDLDHVVATGVRFEDEDGRPVIIADRVDMQYQASELLSGHFVSHSAAVHGGRVILETNAHGVLSVNHAFQSPHPGPDTGPVGADVVHLENLAVYDVTLTADLGGAPVATLRHISAIVLVRAPDGGAVTVEAQHVRGALHVAAPIPFDLRVAAASLVIDGGAHRRAHIDLPARMGSERIGIEITALTQPDASLHVDARIRPHGLGAMLAATSMIAQCLVAETANHALDVTVELQ
jgi:hypothetical protein